METKAPYTTEDAPRVGDPVSIPTRIARDAMNRGSAIYRSQAQDRSHSIPYRPQYTLFTGRPSASILLQQIAYWWEKSGHKPFYKFRAPCEHDRYKPGDSWCEELGFTPGVFDTALKTIGQKITKGTSKTDALRKHVVIYWTDAARMTWYQVNGRLLGLYVYLAYNRPELLGKLGNAIYLDEWGNPFYLDKEGIPIYLFSETTPQTTAETTTDENAPPRDSLPADDSWPQDQKPTTNDKMTAEQFKANHGHTAEALHQETEEARAAAPHPDMTDAHLDIDAWMDRPVKEWCVFIRLPYSEQSAGRKAIFAADLRTIATSDGMNKMPEETGEAIRAMTQSESCQWMRTASRPTHREFAGVLLNVLCGQVLPEPKGVSTGGSGAGGRADSGITDEMRAIVAKRNQARLDELNAQAEAAGGYYDR